MWLQAARSLMTSARAENIYIDHQEKTVTGMILTNKDSPESWKSSVCLSVT